MKINFSQSSLSTQVHFSSLFSEADSFWASLDGYSTIFLLAEHTAGVLFASSIEKILQEKGFTTTVLIVPGGEETKSFLYQEKILSFMINQGLGRDSCLLALGGGALLDVGGFIASIYARGVPFFEIPTTLLAMVDAAIGGKTAINSLKGKNSIGTFYPASHVLIASEFLYSLPDIQMQSALGEIIKYALILEKDLFQALKKGKELWHKKDPAFIEKLIHTSLEAKKYVTEKDPKDTGLRKILNFGHTIAHALESLWSYSVPHGHTVGIGLLIESHLSFQLDLLSEKELNSIVDLLRDYDFTKKIKPFSYDDIEPFLQKDKKKQNKEVRFVLLSSVGKAYDSKGNYCQVVPKEMIMKSIQWYESL